MTGQGDKETGRQGYRGWPGMGRKQQAAAPETSEQQPCAWCKRCQQTLYRTPLRQVTKWDADKRRWPRAFRTIGRKKKKNIRVCPCSSASWRKCPVVSQQIDNGQTDSHSCLYHVLFGDPRRAETVDSGFRGIFSAMVFSSIIVDLTLPTYDIEFQGFNELGRCPFDKSSVFVVIFS